MFDISQLLMSEMQLKLWILHCATLLAGRGQSDPVIYNCPSGKVTVVEDTDVSFQCGFNSNWVRWELHDGDRTVQEIGTCDRTQCNPQYAYPFYLQVYGQKQYTSKLTINKIRRDQALYLVCFNNAKGDSCKLRVIAPVASVTKICNISLADWHVVGNCTLSGMYDSDNNYTCVWRRDNDEIFTTIQNLVRSQALNGRLYTSGVCRFNQTIPIRTGTYTYSVTSSPVPVNLFSTKINITVPGQPIYNCTDVIIPEGSNVTCICGTSVTGNPAATVVWDGRKRQTLFLQNLRRENNTDVYTCRLTWGPDEFINRNVTYIVRVAYGPSGVHIENTAHEKENGTERICLTCTAIDVYPSAVFRWNIACDQQTHNMTASTCTFLAIPANTGILVTCTATNNISSEVYSSSVFVPKIQGSSQVHSSESTGTVSGGLIGGVVAAVIIILILATVIIVYIIKRRKGVLGKERNILEYPFNAHKLFQRNSPVAEPYAVINKPRTQPPIARHAAPSGDLYTIASTTAERASDESTAVCQTVDNEAYGPDSNDDIQDNKSTHQTEDPTQSVKPPVMPKPTRPSVQTSSNVSGTGYMNVTEVPTDSGLGVYHIVPWAATSRETQPATWDTAAPVSSEDEYNVLQFEQDRPLQDDQTGTYHHIHLH